MKLIGWGQTDTGRKRDHNEDNYLVDEKIALFAVADGMGGHRGGATASRMALDVLQRHVSTAIGNLIEAAARIEAERRRDMSRQELMNNSDEMDTVPAVRLQMVQSHRIERSASGDDEDSTSGDTLVELVTPPAITVMRAAAQEASFEIFDASMEDSNLRGMGTTLTAMLYDSGRMHLVHAGDSRAYLFRNGKLEQLTEDHSWIAEQIRSGMMTAEEAKSSKYRHIITRSVGFEREVNLDTRGIVVEAGDCFLLCSDGMSNYVENEELERLISETWFRRLPERLIELANSRGGDDNVTVVTIHAANHTT